MGKKKRSYPNVEDLLARTWCYYCERDFEDLKLLISHQKAKHFKCERCGRRLNTAGGLSVHMSQVHKETLTKVENALPNRSSLDVEIFGMEGIPQDILNEHRNRIIQNFYQAQEDRRVLTGNPVPGGSKPARKKIRIETPEEIKARLAEHRKKTTAQKAAVAAQGGPSSVSLPYQPYPSPAPGQYPGQPPQSFGGPNSLPARPPFMPGASSGASHPGMPGGLPQRPPHRGPNGQWPHEQPPDSHRDDNIDQLIRAAGAPSTPAESASMSRKDAPEKRPKKDRRVRMVYGDSNVSPEECMARLPKYSFIPT